MKNYSIETICVGILETNCYLLTDIKTKETAVIDPGGNSELIIEKIDQLKLKPALIINTHCHIDHISANFQIKKQYNLPLYVHKNDEACLNDELTNGSALIGVYSSKVKADKLLEDGNTISLAGLNIEVIHTPGHTPGGICLLCSDVVFTGDTLFAGSIGRTDLKGGDWDLISKSLEKLKKLPNDTIIYPGHGEPSTIGDEKVFNPYFHDR